MKGSILKPSSLSVVIIRSVVTNSLFLFFGLADDSFICLAFLRIDCFDWRFELWPKVVMPPSHYFALGFKSARHRD